jgi:hypothetical protein
MQKFSSEEMGLGCGNPQAIAALKPGEVRSDLTSYSAFIAGASAVDELASMLEAYQGAMK